jgi:hypothetical protein
MGQRTLAGLGLPALDDDLAVPGVQRDHHALPGQLAQEVGLGGRADHHLGSASVEPFQSLTPRPQVSSGAQ